MLGRKQSVKLGDIKDRLMPMLDDAHWAEQTLDRDDNQFTRRAYIRSVFSMIEGTVWALKQTVLGAPAPPGQKKRLLAGEYELLSDKTYELKSNGQIKAQAKYLRLPENIRFTFSMLDKYFGIEFDLGVGTPSWDKFLVAQDIRNRITHPRTMGEFSVTDKEISICKDACSWFNTLVASLFTGLAERSMRKGGGGNKNDQSEFC